MDQMDRAAWERALTRFRKEKDEFFRATDGSPIPHGQREGFAGLRYFDPDPSLRFETRLQRYSNPASVMMTTSKGTRQLFNRVGYFEVVLDGKASRVQAFQSAERDDPSIFVPFRDGTSGTDSYGAARYLDMEVEHDDNYALDFNYAYNPYCAYSEDYVCPLPPQENWLSAPIRAGEKKFHD